MFASAGKDKEPVWPDQKKADAQAKAIYCEANLREGKKKKEAQAKFLLRSPKGESAKINRKDKLVKGQNKGGGRTQVLKMAQAGNLHRLKRKRSTERIPSK